MAIEIPAAIYDQWVLALEPLAEHNPEERAERHPGGIRMTPKEVLGLLSMADDGVHTVIVAEDATTPSWPRMRVVALDEVVTLSSDDDDEWAKNVVANAEAITGIKLPKGDATS